MSMLHSLFKGPKSSKKTGGSDNYASDSSSDRSSRRAQNFPRLERAKNIRGLRLDDDASVDASRSSLFDADHSSESISKSTCGSISPSPVLQPPSDADAYFALPPLSLNKPSAQLSKQGNSPGSSPRSWDGESDRTGGYLTDSSDSSLESSTGQDIFSLHSKHREGDLQNFAPFPTLRVNVTKPKSPSRVPASPRLVSGNGQGERHGLHIQRSAPNSPFTSPVPSPWAPGPPGSAWLWNRSSVMALSESLSPHHPSPTHTGYNKSSCPDAHPLPLPPTVGTTSPTLLQPAPRSPSKAELGTPVGKWQRGRLLGCGAFGKVYKGIHSETGEFCAIKEVEYVEDDEKSKESAKQLTQEIRLLSSLRHANIVHYKGSEMVDGYLYIYLELVSGGSIYKLYQEFKKLEEPVIRRYTRQILQGLHFLHSMNTIHRDIKGANILVDQEGVVKLADFGMAKQIKEQGAALLSFKGSPYWMAPEVIMQRNTGYEYAIDIWSLGCTVLEMVTGKPPWSEYEGVAAMFKVARAEIPPIPDTLSSDGRSFILSCLHRNPADRPSAAALLEHPFVQITNEVSDVMVHATDFLSPEAGERSTWQENGGSSIELSRGRSQPLSNRQSKSTAATSRSGAGPCRSAPVSPRSSYQDITALNSGEYLDMYHARVGRRTHTSNGVPASVDVIVDRTDLHLDTASGNRQSSHHQSSRLYRTEDSRPREGEHTYSRKPYRSAANG